MNTPSDDTLGKENSDSFNKLHYSGSRWLCLRMQEVFDVQSEILKEIAHKHTNNSLKPVLPLIHGLYTTANSISLLRRDGLLNEAHVLMRLLIERALNVCYLLMTASKTKEEAPEQKANKKSTAKKMLSADELTEAAKAFRFEETYDSKGLELKINTIAANSEIPIAFLRQVVLDHYPQASLALSGSPVGAVFHLFNITEESEDHLANNFAVLIFGGLLLLNHTIKVLKSYGIPEQLVKDSDTSSETAMKIMLRGLKPAASNVRDFYGWWQALADHEYLAMKKLNSQLREFELAMSACVEAGMEVPMLATRDKGTLRLQIAALYLKRLLNDVRSMWLMMRQGYTAQAGSIAASLFENALKIQCLAEDEVRAIRLSKFPSAKWPWDVRAMCNFVNEDSAKREKQQVDQQYADAHYKQYQWLCNIKHPTLGYVGYDSGSTHVEEKGYVVMAFPDVRDEDWLIKKRILLIGLNNSILAIKSFARGGKVKEETPNEVNFATKVKKARDFIENSLAKKSP